jgi:hypothetical protein
MNAAPHETHGAELRSRGRPHRWQYPTRTTAGPSGVAWVASRGAGTARGWTAPGRPAAGGTAPALSSCPVRRPSVAIALTRVVDAVPGRANRNGQSTNGHDRRPFSLLQRVRPWGPPPRRRQTSMKAENRPTTAMATVPSVPGVRSMRAGPIVTDGVGSSGATDGTADVTA